ncbi:MAG: chemotaxis protein CheA [Polyangiaceae bacterium]
MAERWDWLHDIAARAMVMSPADDDSLSRLRAQLAAALSKGPLPEAVESAATGALAAVDAELSKPPTERSGSLDRVVQILTSVAVAESGTDPEAIDVGSRPLPSPKEEHRAGVGQSQDKELVDEFIVEARQYLADSESALLELEANPDDKECVGRLFRAFHTIKGVAAMLGYDAVAAFAHAAESLLQRMREGEVRCTGYNATLVLQSIDMLRLGLDGVVRAFETGEPATLPESNAALVQALGAPEVGAPEPPSTGPGAAPDISPAPEAAKPAPSAKTPPAALIEAAPLADPPTLVEPAPLAEPVAPAPPSAFAHPPPPTHPTPESKAAAKGDGDSGWVRVRTERLDRLIDMVGELVIAQSMVSQDQVLVQPNFEEFRKKVAHGAKIVRELQDLSMALRMVPLKPSFQKLARVVRDVSLRTDKEVRFVTEGDETEIDRNMVSVIADPLVHMVRNAVDHGVCSKEERVASGKPPQALIKLAAFHSGGQLVLRLSDDGKGMDRRTIAAKAIERGIIRSDTGMTDEEVFNLIFEPGFSTRDAVTDISGRGVGMDVVKRSVESLKGRIETTTEIGKGTTFTIHVPLTLAVTDGMLVRVGHERFILPTLAIRTSFRPTREMLSTIAGRGEFVRVRDQFVPVFRLHHLFEVDGAQHDATKALVVVVDYGEGCSAFMVDELLAQQQVVSKGLSSTLLSVPGVAGGAILGDGRVGLILDPPGLVDLAHRTNGFVAAA